jgi:hypothetical protein
VLALVDESYRDGLYLLAFCQVARDRVEETRVALRALPRHARPRFHWHVEQHKDRLAMVDTIAGLGVTSTVVYQTHTAPTKQEQARARLLAVGLHELAGAGVAQLVLESRREKLNRRDERTITAARRDGLTPYFVPFVFARPGDEPLLWLPDAVAGAVGLMLAGRASVYADLLPAGSWTLREVPRA